MVLGKNGGSPGAVSRSRHCILSSGSSFPYLLLRSAQVEVSSLWLGHVPRDYPEDPASPCLWWPCRPPWNLLALIWFSTLVFPATSRLWAIDLSCQPALSTIFCTLHAACGNLYCSCPQEQEASRESGAGLLTLTNNDTPSLLTAVAIPCWSEEGWLNHHLTVSDTNGAMLTFDSTCSLFTMSLALAEREGRATLALSLSSSHQLPTVAVPGSHVPSPDS